jgi:hypothetical protein
MAAIAAYARLQNDPELEAIAKRVRAWAARRAGELLAEIKPAHGANQNIRTATGTNVPTRTIVASEAGLSKRQKGTALRIASIPAEEFEAMVERDKPASLGRLDERARELRGKPSAFMEEAAERRAADAAADPLLPEQTRTPAPNIDLAGRTPAQFRAATKLRGFLPLLIEDLRDIDPTAVLPGLDGGELALIAAQLREIRALLDKVEDGLGLRADV